MQLCYHHDQKSEYGDYEARCKVSRYGVVSEDPIPFESHLVGQPRQTRWARDHASHFTNIFF